jgi:hypothetical protein
MPRVPADSTRASFAPGVTALARTSRVTPFVALARRIDAARLVAARRAGRPPVRSWQEAVAALVIQYPERWAPPEPEPLDELLVDYHDG